jgi:hypothetical protein
MEYRSTTIKVREGGGEREEVRIVMIRKNGGCCEVGDVLASPIRLQKPRYYLSSKVTRSTLLETSGNGQIAFMPILLCNHKPAAIPKPINSHRGQLCIELIA